jgi:hypothetical protein
MRTDKLKQKHMQLAYTINQFCEAVPISRRTLYTLWKRNQGPPRLVIGKRVLIPSEGGEQ